MICPSPLAKVTIKLIDYDGKKLDFRNNKLLFRSEFEEKKELLTVSQALFSVFVFIYKI